MIELFAVIGGLAILYLSQFIFGSDEPDQGHGNDTNSRGDFLAESEQEYFNKYWAED